MHFFLKFLLFAVAASVRSDTFSDWGPNDSLLDSDFTCDTDRHLEWIQVCDQMIDCVDKTDERSCDYDSCTLDPEKRFNCHSGNECVLNEFRCDGAVDCGDASDELGCQQAKNKTCFDQMFACENGEECIPNRFQCDGANECPDGSDEKYCHGIINGFSACRQKFSCGLGRCLKNESLVCDGKPDCPDGRDENHVMCTAKVKCENCSGTCEHRNGHPTCICDNGFEVDNDGSCRDIDECAQNVCSHYCQNTQGSFECHCRPGFVLVNRTRCKNPVEPTFVWFEGHSSIESEVILEQNKTFRKIRVPMADSHDFVPRLFKPPMDYDVESENLYIQQDSSVYVLDLKLQVPQLRRVVPGHIRMTDFAVDHVTSNIYITSLNERSIIICRIKGYCMPLISGRSEMISRLQIARFASGSKLFWIQGSKIMTGSLDGLETQIVHQVGNMDILRCFVVDGEHGKVYAVQSNLIEIDLATGNVRKLSTFDFGLAHDHVWNMAVVDDSIFIQGLDVQRSASGDRRNGYKVYELDRATGDHVGQKQVPAEFQLHSVQRASDRNPQNPCWNPSSCSHLCVASSTEKLWFKCLCPPGMYLDPADNGQCVLEEGQEELFFVSGMRFSTYVFDGNTVYHNRDVNLRLEPFAIAASAKMELIFSTNQGLFILSKNGTRTEIGSRLRNIHSMVVDPVDNVLYAVNDFDLMAIDLRTSAVGLISERNDIQHIDINPLTRTLYVELRNSSLHSMEIGDWSSTFVSRLPTSRYPGPKKWVFDTFEGHVLPNVAVVLEKGYCGFVEDHSLGFNCQIHAGPFSGCDHHDHHDTFLIRSKPSSDIRRHTACQATECAICVTTHDGQPVCVCPYGHEVGVDGRSCSKKCGHDMLRCSATDDNCIHRSARCNGVQDCSAGQDEENCDKYDCGDKFKCTSTGTCIETEFRCDNRSNCPDGSDELNCDSSLAGVTSAPQNTSCDPLQSFCCSDGKAQLSLEMKCNGIAECDDSSDEKNCPEQQCAAPKFHCDEGVCLQPSKVCDGIAQCKNAADERNCHDRCRQNDLFECVQDGRCLPFANVCDGVADCSDKSDEAMENCQLNPVQSNGTEQQTGCFADGFKCRNGQCIQFSQVCDEKPDCSDRSDEGDHCVQHDCRASGCSQSCHSTPSGVRCTCNVGYRLLDDGFTCEDVDECVESPEVCSQFCKNLPGSFSCSCASGYIMNAVGECRVDSGDPIVLAVENGLVEAIRKDKRKLLVLDSRDSEIGGIDYDAVTGLVFVSDTSNNKVHRIPLNTSHVSYVHEVYTQLKPGVLALDWITENLYFADFRPSIHVCTRFMAGAYCTMLTIVKVKPRAGLNEPSITSMALVPDDGLMFYSEHSTGLLFRQNMDGQNLTTFGWGYREKIPLSLTVDHVHKKLYWLNAHSGSIENSDFEGRRIQTLPGHFNFVKTFAIFEDYILFPEPKLEHWVIMHKQTGLIKSSKFSRLGRLTAVKVLHKVNQPHEANRCKNQCQQICLLKPNGFTCACKDGQELSEDNKSCVDAVVDNEKLHDAAWSEKVSQECSCENGGKCVASKMRNKEFYCKCPPGYHGERCESGPTRSLVLTVVAVCFLFILVAAIGVFLIILAARYDRLRKPSQERPLDASDKRILLKDDLDGEDCAQC